MDNPLTGMVPLEGDAMRKVEERAQEILDADLSDDQGKPAPGTVAANGVLTIGGKRYSADELETVLRDYTNDQRWKAENTKDAERLAEQERIIAQERERVNSLVSAILKAQETRQTGDSTAAPQIEPLPEEALVDPATMQGYIDKRLGDMASRVERLLDERLKALPDAISKQVTEADATRHNSSIVQDFARLNSGLSQDQIDAVLAYTESKVKPDTSGRWSLDQIQGAAQKLGFSATPRPRVTADTVRRIRSEEDAAAGVLRGGGGGAPDATQRISLEDLLADPGRVSSLPNDVLLRAAKAIRELQGEDE